jgi:hypothetical protein
MVMHDVMARVHKISVRPKSYITPSNIHNMAVFDIES